MARRVMDEQLRLARDLLIEDLSDVFKPLELAAIFNLHRSTIRDVLDPAAREALRAANRARNAGPEAAAAQRRRRRRRPSDRVAFGT